MNAGIVSCRATCPVDAPAFIAAELIGALAGLMLMNWLLATASATERCGSEIAP